MARTLNYRQAQDFYDSFGAKQDEQSWYEDVATAVIFAHGEWASARSIVELGCGTGRFAHALLSEHAPEAQYAGFDVSETMVALATARLEPFGERAVVEKTGGTPRVDVSQADRYVSNYVLDLLSDEDIEAVFADAHRVLDVGGLACLSSLTFGTTLRGRAVTALWRAAYAIRPKLVGGCRPIRFADYIDEARFATQVREVVEVRGLTSEVWIGRKL